MTTRPDVHPAPVATSPHPRRWGGLAVLSVALLLIVMDVTILNVALPAISADLRPDAISLLWMVDVYPLVVSGLLVAVSALGDRWGRKRMLLAGFTLFGLASTAVLWIDTTAGVIAVRALLGVGGAMIMPSTLSMIRTLFTEPRERATALGIWAAMAAVGGALGPILGGALLEHFSWHAAFLVNVPVMVVALLAGVWLLPEYRVSNPGRWDALGTALSMVGMVALVFAIKHVGADGPTAPVTLLAAAVAVVALGWFTRRCLYPRGWQPMLEVRLFGSGPFTAGALTAVVAELAMAAMMLVVAQWAQLVAGYGPLETGLRLLPIAVAAAIASPLAPMLAARIGQRPVLVGGLVVTGIGFGLIGIAPPTYPWLAGALALIGAGMGALAIASAIMMASVPKEKAGSAAAIEETGYELGAALGVAVLGSVAVAVYRGTLRLDGLGLDAGAERSARESLNGAIEVAGPGSELAARAREAFVVALETVGYAGGAVMLAAAALAWVLTRPLARR